MQPFSEGIPYRDIVIPAQLNRFIVIACFFEEAANNL
jgi:hypothetical protein